MGILTWAAIQRPWPKSDKAAGLNRIGLELGWLLEVRLEGGISDHNTWHAGNGQESAAPRGCRVTQVP